MKKTIKTDAEILLRIAKGLIFTDLSDGYPGEISWHDLIIEKMGNDIFILTEKEENFDRNKRFFYLKLSDLAICEYLKVESLTGTQVIQYIKEQSKLAKFKLAKAKSRNKPWAKLDYFWDDLANCADGIILAEAYHGIQKEIEIFDKLFN